MKKKIIRLTESDIQKMVLETLQTLDNKGPYEYPEAIWNIILMAENDRNIMDKHHMICEMLLNHLKRGKELSVEKLMNSSVMKNFQQDAFRLARQYEIQFNPKVAAPQFRQYWAQRMIEQVTGDDYWTQQWKKEPVSESKLNEGTTIPEDMDLWYYIKDTIGDDQMLEALLLFLDEDYIHNFCEYALRTYEIEKPKREETEEFDEEF